MSNIKDFLDTKPDLSQILDFVEVEAQRIATEKKASIRPRNGKAVLKS